MIKMSEKTIPVVLDFYRKSMPGSWASDLEINEELLPQLLKECLESHIEYWITDEGNGGYVLSIDSVTYNKPVIYVNHFINFSKKRKSFGMLRHLKERAKILKAHCVIFANVYKRNEDNRFNLLLKRQGFKAMGDANVWYTEI